MPDYEAHMNIGVTLEDMGRFEDAVTAYCDAILHRSNFTDAKQNLANLLKTYSPSDLTKSTNFTRQRNQVANETTSFRKIMRILHYI